MKTFAIIVSLISLSIAARAQEQARFGIKAGINSSSLNTNDNTNPLSSRGGFLAGGIALFPVSKSLAVQTELLYSQEGSNSSNATFEMQYIRVPVLFQYRHNSGFHAEAGPQLGYLISHKASLKENEEEIDIDDHISKGSVTIAIGCGYRLKNGLGLNIRYAKGIDNPIAAQNAKLVVISGGLSFVF